jgi:hypothetical protein
MPLTISYSGSSPSSHNNHQQHNHQQQQQQLHWVPKAAKTNISNSY